MLQESNNDIINNIDGSWGIQQLALLAASGMATLVLAVALVAAFLPRLLAAQQRTFVVLDNSNIYISLQKAVNTRRRIDYGRLQAVVTRWKPLACSRVSRTSPQAHRWAAAALRWAWSGVQRPVVQLSATLSLPNAGPTTATQVVKAALEAAGFTVKELRRLRLTDEQQKEQGVDEAAHQFMTDAALLSQQAPWTLGGLVQRACGFRDVLVLCSGDGNANDGLTSFPERCQKALAAGMDVEVCALRGSISGRYWELAREWPAGRWWTPGLRVVVLDRHIPDFSHDLPQRRRPRTGSSGSTTGSTGSASDSSDVEQQRPGPPPHRHRRQQPRPRSGSSGSSSGSDTQPRRPYVPRQQQPQQQQARPYVPRRQQQPQQQQARPYVPRRQQPQQQQARPYVPRRRQPQQQQARPYVPRRQQPQQQQARPYVPRRRQPQQQQARPYVPRRNQPRRPQPLAGPTSELPASVEEEDEPATPTPTTARHQQDAEDEPATPTTARHQQDAEEEQEADAEEEEEAGAEEVQEADAEEEEEADAEEEQEADAEEEQEADAEEEQEADPEEEQEADAEEEQEAVLA